MATTTVLVFGGRAPAKVLDLLAKIMADTGTESIIPVRSQSIPLALCEAPYRTFLTKDKAQPATTTTTTTTKKLLLYCLPTSVSEYIAASSEATTVRNQIMQDMVSAAAASTAVVVAIYSVQQDAFLGGDSNALLQAILGTDNNNNNIEFSRAALVALAELDQQVSSTLLLQNNNNNHPTKDVVIVVGSGGREHALAVALAKSPMVGQVICCPGNGGTAVEGGKIINAANTKDESNATVLHLVQQTRAKMVVVGPEAPLVAGLVDELAFQCPDVLVFGPTQAAAELEASKAFTKDFLQQHGIPTAKYQTFTSAEEAIAYVESLDESDRQVVKASGLAAGKGVLIPENREQTIAAVREIMLDKAFGAAGDTCVIESFLTGPEASCFALCDGTTAVLMPAAQDHKRALDNDQGLNTGGMGAYAPAPCVTPQLHKEIEAMCIKTVEKMAERGTPYVGLLYAGIILTPNGPYMLEYNCRFGDPETQVVLPLLETDLYEVFTACCTGNLAAIDVRFKENTHAATVVCAAKGYPETYPKGMEIVNIHAANSCDGVKVYHAGTKIDDAGVTRCSGGRVLAVTGTGKTLQAALNASYKGVAKLQFRDETGQSLMHYRTDIGRKAVEKKLRIGVMGSTRGTALIPVIEACASGSINAEIVAVLSNRSEAPILEKGRALGVTVSTKFISAKGLTRDQYDAECTANLVKAGVEFVLLVGYMRILSKPFTDYWKGRCINVHPSLLPKHAGGMDLQVHQAVLDAGEKETGCSIHQVTEQVDGGPIMVQKVVQVEDGDTAETLKAKVQAQEGLAFIEAIELFCRGGIVTYADAGVNIDEGNRLVQLIKPLCKSTRRSGCDADIGGFGGLFDLAAAGYNTSDTVLIGATDGVGTKLRIAHATKKHESVGIDLVAMCVNDLIVAGGEPLFFLDYFATGRLEVAEAADVVKGIAEGCRQAMCGLIGGETAEMPSMYSDGEYDLAGFSVGAVHRDRILPQNVQEGDVLLGLSSSGIHSNGFSLVRKLIENEGLDFSSACPWDASSPSIGDSLLTPTKIYVKACLPLIKDGMLKGLAHITGGGLLENLPRSLPNGLAAEITGHPALPPVFKWMKKSSGLDDTEMLRTFNCGVGMVLILDEQFVPKAIDTLASGGETEVYRLGTVVKGSGVRVVAPLE